MAPATRTRQPTARRPWLNVPVLETPEETWWPQEYRWSDKAPLKIWGGGRRRIVRSSSVAPGLVRYTERFTILPLYTEAYIAESLPSGWTGMLPGVPAHTPKRLEMFLATPATAFRTPRHVPAPPLKGHSLPTLWIETHKNIQERVDFLQFIRGDQRIPPAPEEALDHEWDATPAKFLWLASALDVLGRSSAMLQRRFGA